MNILNIFSDLSSPVKIGLGILFSLVIFGTVFFIIRTYFKKITKKEGFQENTTAPTDFTFSIPLIKVCAIIQEHITLTKESLDKATAENNKSRIEIFSTLLSSMNSKFESLNCVFNKDSMYADLLENSEMKPLIELVTPILPTTADQVVDQSATAE
jgi:hypothetical protein